MWTPNSSDIITAEQKLAEARARIAAMATVERDRRIADGFLFNGQTFQAREQDLANINGAVSIATIAVMSGAQPGDLFWSDPSAPFAWLTTDNQTVTMDAQTVLAFGAAAAKHKTTLVWKARAIKDAIEAGTFTGDVTNDTAWT